MGIIKNEMTAWLNVFEKSKKYDLTAHAESMKLLIDVNNSELSAYIAFIIATFSIFTPIYFIFWNFNLSFVYYLGLGIFNLVILIVLIKKIRAIKQCNDSLIEGFNAIQAKRGKSFLVRIDGEKKVILEKIKEIKKEYNFE